MPLALHLSGDSRHGPLPAPTAADGADLDLNAAFNTSRVCHGFGDTG
ncbi:MULTISPECIES: hypothetical protein [unclassified Streptomyces]|nr:MULTISPECIES: hypothetical protein [unclassified Streptomyces]